MQDMWRGNLTGKSIVFIMPRGGHMGHSSQFSFIRHLCWRQNIRSSRAIMNLDCATEEYGARYRGTFSSLDGNASSNDVTGTAFSGEKWRKAYTHRTVPTTNFTYFQWVQRCVHNGERLFPCKCFKWWEIITDVKLPWSHAFCLMIRNSKTFINVLRISNTPWI